MSIPEMAYQKRKGKQIKKDKKEILVSFYP